MSEEQHAPLIAKKTWTRTLTVWGIVIACVSVCVVTLTSMSKARHAKPVAIATPAPVMTVSVVPVSYDTLSEQLVATGTVRAVDPLSVGAEVNGLRIVSVEVEEGSQVRKGQVLATLNRSILSAQLNQSRARYQGSLASVSKALQPNRPQDIAGLDAALSQAHASEMQEEANLIQARTNLETSQRTAHRYSTVLDDGFVTAQEAQDRTTEVQRNQALLAAAQARLEAARYNTRQAKERLGLANAGGRSEDVTLAQSNSQEMAANIDYLQAQVDQTVIRAPDDGLVLQRDAHVGDIVSTTKSLFSIARLSQMELRAQVPEIDLGRVRVGDRANLNIGGKIVPGRVWLISPAVDPNSRLGTVRILLDVAASRHNGVLPGMFARADLKLGGHKAMLVPSAAVRGENDSYFVYLYNQGDSKVKKQRVQPGARSKDNLEIVDGLSADSRVVVTGASFLADGDLVTVSQQ